ncbi:siderophore-interacting protein [Krasilnikoviella flava]|uniref:NADPH-dependent ferric siderophore reductase, contains FAD-binding and SIP domains n=1 Tax=Krasilnikoviella flava TaxID=526729 RepID=A0A1T5JNH4_9MICO|nr:siderophore-interacting protein [Krasilnikoviella flava]SKC52832.1 NADPH-dependent ferric siderophore reductase, contains FAD-binding and SIP domains [Krasilnikoviella flava]
MSDNQPGTPVGPPARKRTPHHATVSAVRRLTPHLVRVTIAGPELATLDPTGHTDSYVKLVLGELTDGRPLLRAYTVRAARGAAAGTSGEAEWDIDLVVHGDEGVGGPWATRVQPGEEVSFMGPGGDYAPDAAAPWHLLVGDDSALPAVAAALEALPAGAVAHAVVEVPGPADELPLETTADLTLTWVHRGSGDGVGLAGTVRAAHAAGAFPAGAPHVFLHGEAGCVRDLRRWVRAELGVPRELLSASGYWRRGSDDEDWRARKGEWKTAVEQDDAALTVAG